MVNRKTIDVNAEPEVKPATKSEAQIKLEEIYAAYKKQNPAQYERKNKEAELARLIANL